MHAANYQGDIKMGLRRIDGPTKAQPETVQDILYRMQRKQHVRDNMATLRSDAAYALLVIVLSAVGWIAMGFVIAICADLFMVGVDTWRGVRLFFS